MKDTQEKIPANDLETWETHPKLAYLLDTGRLLEIQNIEVTPFCTKNSKTTISRFNLDKQTEIYNHENHQSKGIDFGPYVFTNLELSETPLISHAIVIKGNVEYLNHIGTDNGLLDLKLHSFCNIHLSKYRGLVQFETIGNIIVGVKLAVDEKKLLSLGYTKEWLAALQKVYTNHTWKFTPKTLHLETT